MSRVLLTVALTGSMLGAAGQQAVATGPNAAGPAATTGTSASSTPASSLVTLITGDRVLVQGDSYQVLDNPARRDVTFLSYRHNGHLHVIPSDALGLLGTELDSRLFDVTALVEMGYGDGRDLGLIIKHGKEAKAATHSSVTKGGAKVAADLKSVNAMAVRADRAKPGALWSELATGNGQARKLRPGITKVWLDGVINTTLDHSVPAVGAPAAWNAGLDGTGVKVAVIDTGIDSKHPDLAGKVLASANFTTESPEDLVGHGTHVGSTVAGTGAASGGKNRGVAPGAQLLDAKVCYTFGCPESAILQGMQWAADQGADVVNMSLGGSDMAGVDPLEEAVNTLTASHGILFVIAAGNTNPPVSSYTVSSPSTADAALSVGAVDPGDGLAYFSNRGPRVGDTALKPDMTAPGMFITAARSSSSELPGDLYTDMQGTSMATPHVAGAAAILAQQFPSWTPAQMKAALMGSAVQPATGTPVFDQGSGRLDVARGHQQSVLADPPSVSLGRAVGPHEDDPVLTRTITYTNMDTANAVDLSLSISTQAPGGGAAPAGMFALSAPSLRLPPGGSGSVTLTATTSLPAPDGFYGGWVVATGNAGAVRVSTAFAVDRSVPGREITFNNVNRAGQFTPGYVTLLLPLTPGRPVYPLVSNLPAGPSGPRTEFVENGDYILATSIREESTGYADTSLIVHPRFTVNASTPSTVDLLASQAQPVDITVPDASARTYVTEVAVGQPGNGLDGSGAVLLSRGQVYTKQLGPVDASYPGFMAKVHRMAYVPAKGRDDDRNSPAVYNLAWFPQGQFPTGFTRNVTADRLARRTVTYGRNVPDSLGTMSVRAHPADTLLVPNLFTDSTIFDLPHTRTEFVSTDDDVRWSGMFYERTFPDGLETIVGSQESAPARYEPGSRGTYSWNQPVYGPALGNLYRPEDWVVRQGDTILFLPPLLGDSAGHSGHAWTIFNPLPGLEGQAVLKRNGVVVATADLPHDPGLPRPAATVPAGPAQYTLEATQKRGGPVDLATQVSAVWTFKSSSVDPGSVQRLPLWSVSFKPDLDADNAARPGSFAIPLTAVAQPGSPVAGMKTITVQYSTDDGATWKNATVTGSGADRIATVLNPVRGYVSLRVTARDSAGNSVTQTTIRGYRAQARRNP